MCGSVSDQLFLMDTKVPTRLYRCEICTEVAMAWDCRILDVPNQKDACRAVVFDKRAKTYRFCKRTFACKTHAVLNSVDRIELGNSSRSIEHSIRTSHEYRFNQQEPDEPASPMRGEHAEPPPDSTTRTPLRTPQSVTRPRQEAAGSSRYDILVDAIKDAIEVLKAAIE